VTSAIENNVALITASAPALMPLLRTWFPNLFGSDSENSTGGQKVALRDMKARVQLRGQSPRISEEEEMTYDGIVRKERRRGRDW